MNPTHRVKLPYSPKGFQVPIEAKRLTDSVAVLNEFYEELP